MIDIIEAMFVGACRNFLYMMPNRANDAMWESYNNCMKVVYDERGWVRGCDDITPALPIGSYLYGLK